MKRVVVILAGLLAALVLWAGSEGKSKISFDNTVCDFGTVCSGEPVSCTFTAVNGTSSPISILSVISHCSCTSAKWTKTPIESGKQGTVEVTYSNDEGDFPFDKALYVYLSDSKKPVILHIRGISVSKEKE